MTMRVAKATDSFPERCRNLKSFNPFYQAVVFESDSITLDPVLPRQKKVPKRIDQGTSSYKYQSANEYFWQQYYEDLHGYHEK